MSEPALHSVSDSDTHSRERFRTEWGIPIPFLSRHTVQFCEVDPFGHMNTNHYLSYFTENRFIGHREALGLTLKDLARFPIAPHIRKAELEFIRPVYADSEFVIESFLSELRESHCIVDATMTTPAGALYATCKFTIACVDKRQIKATPWPHEFIRLYYSPDAKSPKGGR